MAEVSKTGEALSGVKPDDFRREAFVGFVRTWGLLGLASAGVLFAIIQQVSPSLVAIVLEYKSVGYYAVEALYLLPPLAFLLLLSLAGFASYVGRLRPMLGLGLLSLALATVIAVFLADPSTDFATEASKITIFTTAVLVLCGVTSAINYLSWTYRARRAALNRIFWALLSFAFLFAAADEALMIHERLGRLVSAAGQGGESGGSLQDGITIIYALGALLVVGVAGMAIRAARENKHHIAVFVLAGLVYLASTILDTANGMLRTPPVAVVDLPHMANTVEEILEFVAASLFLFGCLVAFLEARHNELFVRGIEDHVGRWCGRRLRIAVLASLGAFLLVSAATALLSPPRGLDFRGTRDLAVQSFIGQGGDALHPDGVTTAAGGIYVANDEPPTIAVLDPRSGRRTFVDVGRQARTPESVAVAGDGRVFFTDDGANAVYVLDRQHKVTSLLGPGDGLRSPKGLAIAPSGDLYIADVGASAIFRYSGGQLSIYASALDGIALPEELAFDSRGNLYVTEDQRRVLKVRPDLRSSMFLSEAPGFTPEAIAIRDDRIYLTDSGRGAVLEYDLARGVGRRLITLPAALGRKLEGLAVAANGDVWVGIRPSHGIPGTLLRIYKRGPAPRVPSRI